MAATFPRHAATLKWAERELGVAEDPPRSNNGARVRFYQAHTWLRPPPPGQKGWPWCVAFVLAAAEEGGGFTFPEPSAGAWDLFNRVRPRGWVLTVAQKSRVQPGDFAVFNTGAGHIAVVKSLEGVNVRTIDGNSGDKVSENVRSLDLVRGFVHWPEQPVAVVPVKPPRTQVVTSESGSRRLVHAKTGVSVALHRVDVTVDGRRRNTRQRPDNPALLKRIALFIKRAKVVTITRSKTP